MARTDLPTILIAALAILYPLVAMIAVRLVGPSWVVAGLCGLLVLRSVAGLKQKIPAALTYAMLGVAVMMAAAALYDRDLSVRLYPAFMNLAMLIAFAQTLIVGPSMIERFARLMEPNLAESGVRYTYRVTWVWVAFFAVNGAIAVWTALYADWRTWTLYNGVIAYVAMGVLFAGELLVRRVVRSRATS
jgi:uncharacterized membrane protein